MTRRIRHALIMADIEGSSGCRSYADSQFMTPSWPEACRHMTLDVNAVAAAAFEAGVKKVSVRDFHRTGYNLLPDLLDRRVVLLPGYRRGAVPGVGHPGDAEVVLFTGMHAASGAGGFLAHTFTSRINRLEVNGAPMPEAGFFAASLAPFGIRPVFFSGCPVACAQAETLIPGLATWAIDKSHTGADRASPARWRAGLFNAALRALNKPAPAPFLPAGPFAATVDMKGTKRHVRKMARRWGLPSQGNRIFIRAGDINALYLKLIRLCYFTPFLYRILPLSLALFNLRGRLGRAWARRRLRKFRGPP